VVVQGVGTGTGNPIPTPTPSTTTLSQLTNDELSLQGSTNYSLNIEYVNDSLGTNSDRRVQGTFTIIGSRPFSQTEYVASLNVDNYLLYQPINIVSFKLTKDVSNPNLLFGTFISPQDISQSLNTISLKSDYNYVDFNVDILGYSYVTTKSIAQFKCPNYQIKYHDIVEYSLWQQISTDPCCKCYPTGTGGEKVTLKQVTNNNPYTTQNVECNITGSNC